jgi:ATP-dependent Lon protease
MDEVIIYDLKPRNKRQKLSDSKDDKEDDDPDYFEKNTDLIQQTITNHILNNLSRDQRKALKSKIKKGVYKGINLCNDIVVDKLNEIIETKPTNNCWKLGMGPKQIKKYKSKLISLRKNIAKSSVSIQRILDANLTDNEKKELLILYDIMQTQEKYSIDYNTLEKKIDSIINTANNCKFTKDDYISFDNKEKELSKLMGIDIPLKVRILQADIDDYRKAAIYEKYLLYEKTISEPSTTTASLLEWIEEALKTPYTKIKETSLNNDTPAQCLIKLKQCFEEKLSNMDPKILEEILVILNNQFHNPNTKGTVLALVGNPGVGKCLGKGTPILMFDGSIKKVEDITVNSLIMGDDSTPRTVLSICSGKELMYLVKQDYGDDYRVNESHILSLKLSKNPCITDNNGEFTVLWYNQDNVNIEKVKYTNDNKLSVLENLYMYTSKLPQKGSIIDIPIIDYIKRPYAWKQAYKGYKVGVDYNAKQVPVEPYLFGCYLSKGDNRIPDIYLKNTKTVRKSVLAGLIDTNTFTIKDSYVFKCSNKLVINDLYELVSSLGYKAILGRTCYEYHILISGITDLPLKKTKLLLLNKDPLDYLMYNIQVIEETVDEYYGFEIDGNKRFVLGDYTVTHNTAIGQTIANAWNMPFKQISFGGIKEASIIDGSNSVWIGSTTGYITKAFQEMGVVNGVLFFDEIDKLSETAHGLQVQWSLLHCLDPIQNHRYVDNYLGPKLPIDMSRCFIICALNSTEGLDPALLNRLHLINVPDYTNTQKIQIAIKHLFPDALKDAGLTNNDIIITENGCKEILEKIEKEGGVRLLKAAIKSIVNKLGLYLRTTAEERKKLNLLYNINMNVKPLVINSDIVNLFIKQEKRADICDRMYI